jgi:hypothetical protein
MMTRDDASVRRLGCWFSIASTAPRRSCSRARAGSNAGAMRASIRNGKQFQVSYEATEVALDVVAE